ncbi:MAG: serine hydrolase [Candidatus Nanopelagicales bacterium]
MLAQPVTATMTGFPVAPENLVTLANWQDPPFNRWAFRHLREVIPTHRIAATGAATGNATALPADPRQILGIPVERMDGSESTVADVLATTDTDAVVVVHGGRIVHESYAPDMPTDTAHLLMSVSKSVVSCVAGVLVARGVLDVEAPVATYVPEVAGSGYDEATVRHLLDMRTGVGFREEYTSLDAEVRVMERSMGWRPLADGDPVGMYAFLTTLKPEGRHGGPFVYRSADTDMLGWVVERAAGVRMADLISELVWQPIGTEHDADITCDAVGSAVHDGGMSATARDLARFGLMLLNHGRVGERDVVPASWVDDALQPDDDVREAFAGSDSAPYLPNGWYRNQFWCVPGSHGTVLLCLGIHGQMVHVNRVTDTVAVKLSSWPDAQDPARLVDTIRAFSAVGANLSES